MRLISEERCVKMSILKIKEITYMKTLKKALAVIMVSMIAVMSIFVTGCNQAEAKAAVQVDLNPSVEFVVDKNNKVVRVTALNDDGAVIISGEAFVGKDINDAVNLFVQVSTETGYLLKGEGTVSKDEISLSVSANGETAKQLYNDIKEKVDKYIEDNKVGAKIEEGKAFIEKSIKERVKECFPDMTDEELDALTYEELLKKLDESRKETQEILCAAIREDYYKVKNYNVSFEKFRAEYNTFSRDLDDAVKTVFEGINNGFKSALDSVQKQYNDMIVDPDSMYQKALTEVLNQKQRVLAQKKAVNELPEGKDKEAAQKILEEKEALLDTAEKNLVAMKTNADKMFKQAADGFNKAMTNMQTAYKTYKNFVDKKVNDNSKKLEDEINKKKDGFFEEFEKKYEDALKNYDRRIETIKAQMKNAK